MDALTALHTRISVAKVTEPAPSQEQLAVMFKAAMRAADHGLLRPWKFLVIEGDRREDFGKLMRDFALESKPELSDLDQRNIINKALRAPTIIVAVASIKASAKIPEVEQLLSAGAAAQMLVTAAYAQGLGAIWRTGAVAFSKTMHEGLQLSASDKIIGFVYVGTPSMQKPLVAPDYQDYVTHW